MPVNTRSNCTPPRADARVVDVGLDEGHVIPGFRDEGARLLDRSWGEVQAGHPGAQARKTDGVGADVALQVHAAQPANVAEPEPVEPHHLADESRVVDEPLHVVAGRHRVRWRPLIPVGAVGFHVFVHAPHHGTMPPRLTSDEVPQLSITAYGQIT